MMTMKSRGYDPFLSVEDDDDYFFESYERMSTAVPVNLDSIEYEDDDDDDDYDDSRVSFSSAVGGPARPSSADCRFSTASLADLGAEEEYHVWMAEPISIEERRRRLLAGMGLSKEIIHVDGADFSKLKSVRVRSESVAATAAATPAPPPAPTAEATTTALTAAAAAAAAATREATREEIITSAAAAESVLTRSRSDGSVVFPPAAERSGSAVTLRRSKSAPSALCGFRRQKVTSGDSQHGSGIAGGRDGEGSERDDSVFKIKDLNTGKEFVVNELRDDGSLNQLRDPQTGKQLTLEEFEKCVGHSPIVTELMRRANSEKQAEGSSCKASSMARKSAKKRSWLKNIRGVANSVSELIGEWEKDNPLLGRSGRHATACSPNDWMKVHHYGKSYKEFTGLYMCQEIQAHKGSIWTIRFSPNSRYLASAGEDRVVHVWQVIDSNDLPSVISEEFTSPLQSPMRGSHSMDRPPIPPLPADAHIWERKKRGKLSGSGRRGVRENVQVPSTMFSLSDKPFCSFEGHQDDVLDLSWSKSQQLLSSSMDKTVRLWDMETKTCLKLFAHNDYVTCIQFNPIDDQYFISGSLDAKVRIWSIPDRQVVDWTDLHEMVTAACYTPDGKGALVGSHKGSCRFYDTSDYKLNQTAQIDIKPKKKKSGPKKMTGFQFSPAKPSEVLVTSADSQIRVFDGVDLIHKFRGFKNTSSQISASFSHDGRYVVCASEDSRVYIWKCEEYRNVGGGKRKGFMTTRSHEHFHCKDVSVAIPWPGSNKYEPPLVPMGSRRQNQQQQSSKNMNSQQLGAAVSSGEDASLSGSNRGHARGPPLPKKSFSKRTSPSPSPSPSPEEESAKPSRGDSGSSTANGSSGRLLGLSSSSSTSSGWRWYDASRTLGGGVQAATAWGLAFVTAGLGGELKTYQNFGLPVRLSRQTILKANAGF